MRKQLLTLFFCGILILFSVPFVFSVGEGWLDGWDYRKSHSLTGSSGAGTNYQIQITVDYGSGSDSGDTVYVDGACETDFDDIRFTDDDGETLLDYWLEDKTDSDHADFWIEVADDLDSNQLIYVYYGNSGASSVSSGSDTFELFDEMDSIGDWTITAWWHWSTSYSLSISSGNLYLYGTNMGRGVFWNNLLSLDSDGIAIEGRVKTSQAANTAAGWFYIYDSLADASNNVDYYGAIGDQAWNDHDWAVKTPSGTTSDNDEDITNGVYYVVSSRFDDGLQEVYVDGTLEGSRTDSITYPASSFALTCQIVDTNGNTGYIWCDYIYVRSFCASEPSHGAWGSEEEEGAPPVNVSLSISDLDDSDNMYAYNAGGYNLHYSGYDDDGYADVDMVLVNISQGSTVRACFKYDVSGDSFSLVSGDYELGSSTDTCSGVWINLTFAIMPKWGTVEEADIELTAFINDTAGASDSDTLQSDYADVVTSLLVTGFSCDDDRGNIEQTITFSGTVYYANDPGSGTASAEQPMDVSFTDVEIWDAGDVSRGYDDSLSSGYFEVSFTASSSVELNTYNPYLDMDDDDGDQEESPTDTFITDQIVCYSESLDDSRVDVDSSIEWRILAVLDYDDEVVGAGDSITSSWGALTWDSGNSWWDISHSESSVTSAQISLSSGSETGYGITAFSENITESSGIYDRIYCTAASCSDGRTNLEESETIDFTLKYEYDDAALTDGSVNIAGAAASHQGSGVWRISDSESSVMMNTYDVFTASGGAYGISVVNQNGQSVSVIWDQIICFWEELDDSRVDLNVNIEWRIKAVLDYDDEELGSGDSLSCSWGALTWDSGNSWWDISHTEGTVQGVTISLTAGSEADYGITYLSENITETTGIYDQIVAYWESLDDSRVNVDDSIEWRIRAVLDYDDHSLGSGDTLSCSWDDLTWDAGNSWWDIPQTESTVQGKTITLTGGSEVTYGISSFSENITETTGIWDRIQLLTLSSNDTALYCGNYTEIYATAQLEYDAHPLGAGDSLTIEGLALSWDDVNEWFDGSETYAVETQKTYDEGSGSEADYGITVLNMDSLSVLVEWFETGGGGAVDEDFTDPGDLAALMMLSFIFIPMLILFLALTRRKK